MHPSLGKITWVALCSALVGTLILAGPLPNNGENSWGTLDLCSVNEYYVAEWGACNLDKRTVRYERPSGSCLGPQFFETQISCECRLQDYEPILADPNCGIEDPENSAAATTTLIGWIPRPEARCNPNAAIGTMLNSTVTDAHGAKVIVNCPCTTNLVSSYTTACDPSSSLRSVVYYWSRPCMQTERVRLPAPRFISCDLTCGGGYYFDANDATCYECPAGTRSSSGLTYSEPWTKLPNNFSTECEGNECDAWGPHGNYISSGLNYNKKNIRSTLNFSFQVEKPSAQLSITYRLSSQADRDSFKVKIRGRTALEDSGITPVWKTLNVVLEDFADSCPWNIRWMKGGTYDDHCLLRTKLSPSSSKMAEMLQENSRIFHYDRVLIPEKSGCEWWAFDRPETWKATDRVIVFVPIGDCPLEKKISYAQRSKMDALVIVTEQFLHQITLPELGENPAFPVYVVRLDMSYLIEEYGARYTPWFDYRSIPDMGLIPVELIYEKNGNTESSGHVLVKDIHVTSPKDGLAASVCIVCPPGTVSAKASSTCIKCPMNTFNNDYRSLECKPCPSGYISEEGSTNCIKVRECSIEDYYPIEDHSCRLAANGTRVLERGVSYLQVNPTRCFMSDNALKAPSPKKLPCASCPDGHILEFSGMCTPCENLLAPSDSGDRCVACPPKKAVYPVRNYQGFHSLRGSFPASWKNKCEACDTIGWKFLPYRRNYNTNADVNDFGTGIGVGGELFLEGVATLEIPFELIQMGDVYFTYSYNELSTGNSDDLSTVTFQVINPMEETPIAAKLDSSAHNFGSFTTPRLHPGQYIARWTYLKDPTRFGSAKPEPTERQSTSGFILQTLVIHGEKTGSGTCQECIIGHECETGILMPCPVGTYSNASTEYKCLPCPKKSIAEKGSSKCLECPNDTVPSDDKRVCVLERTIHRLEGSEVHEILWNDLPPMFGPSHIDIDQDASEISSVVANRRSEQTLYVLNKYADPSYRSIVSRLPLDFNKDIYGPSMYVISSDNVMRIGDIKSISLSDWLGAQNSTDHLTDSDIRNVTLPFTDILYETSQPCEVNNLHYTANIRFHCNTTYAEPWISKVYYEPSKCAYNMHVHFAQACPTCLRMKLFRSTSPCIDGVHDVYTRYIASDNYTCYDRRVLAIPQYTRESCNISDQIETSAQYITILSILLIFALFFLCYFAVKMYQKHQRLYETYHSISGTRGGYRDEEMKSINAHVPPGVVID